MAPRHAAICCSTVAHFLTAPGFDCDIVTFAAEHDMVSMPGALTPTEVVTAWRAGADFVKVFPAAQVGGDGYVRALSRSLPQVSLIASGGVNQQNAEAFILAGATAIGVGTQLIPTESIEKRHSQLVNPLGGYCQRQPHFCCQVRKAVSFEAARVPRNAG